ncbi:MAG: hypothetical protein ACTSSH_00140 [Candidatus Heimdallarchaeota archaeon]
MATSYYKRGKRIVRIRDGKETWLNEIGSANRARHMGGLASVPDYSSYKKPSATKPKPRPRPAPVARPKPVARPAPKPAPKPAPAPKTSAARYQKTGQEVIDIQTGKWLTAERSKQIAEMSGGWNYVPSYSGSVAKPAPVAKPTLPKPVPVVKPVAPVQPVAMPEVKEPSEYASIRKVFGEGWKPAPIFEQRGLTGQGVYGAVRIKGTKDVYTIGKGGRKETAESYAQKFGTSSQSGIVGEITAEQARKLGISVPVPDRGKIDLGDGNKVPVTVIPKKGFLDTLAPEEPEPKVSVSELAGLGERFGIEGVGEIPSFREGLTAEQRRNIETLIKTKPESRWTDKDWEDYRWATEGTTDAEPVITGNPVIDAYNKRPDVQAAIARAFPGQDPFRQGSEANKWLNDWWNRTGRVEMAEQIPITEEEAVVTGEPVIDYYNKRPDVKAAIEEAFPGQDPFQQGTEANTWLNDWWNSTGRAESEAEAEVAGEVVTEEKVTGEVVTGDQSLIDIYNSREDLQKEVARLFPGQDPLEAGTEANKWLNDWWNSVGKSEYPDVSLVEPTDETGVSKTEDADAIIPDADDEQKTFMQTMVDKIRELFGIKKTAYKTAAEELGMEEKSQKITDIQNLIQDRKEYWEKETARIKNRIAPMSAINAELGRSESRRIAEMANLEIREAIAQGNWDRAHDLAKESADDAYAAAELEIKALEIQGDISKDEKDNLMDMLKFHKDLLLEGFVPITEEETVGLPVENYITFPDGSIYALPVEGLNGDIDTQAITLPDGRIQLINKKTGAVIKTYGTAEPEKTDKYKDAQYKAATYATRMTNASKIITGMEADLKDKWAVTQWLEGIFPNWMKPADRQVYEQAMRNFVNAVLRQESGAAIAESEFESAKKQYFPQPGDSQAVIDQKRKNRQTSIDGMVEQAGGAFKDGGGGTPTASLGIVAEKKVGSIGGQCGRFVNSIAKLGVGDTYASKMAKMDKSIKTPAPGMVFTMPYKNTGHCGFILSIKDGIATVKDSNWLLDKKIKIHTIPVSKMTGFAYINRLA